MNKTYQCGKEKQEFYIKIFTNKVNRNQTVLIHTVHFNFMQVSSLREKEQADSSAPKRVAETSIMAAASTSKKSRYCCS